MRTQRPAACGNGGKQGVTVLQSENLNQIEKLLKKADEFIGLLRTESWGV
jgi:hypothetical protein